MVRLAIQLSRSPRLVCSSGSGALVNHQATTSVLYEVTCRSEYSHTLLYVNTSAVTVCCRYSILIEMLARLFLGRHLGEVQAFQPLDGEVGGQLSWSKGVGQDSIFLQRVQCLVERCR